MAKLTDEQKQKKLLDAIRKHKKPISAKQAVELTGLGSDDVKAAGKALMKAGKVRFTGESKNLLELVPAKVEATAKAKTGKAGSKKKAQDDDDDDWDEDGDDDDDDDGDGDSDPDDDGDDDDGDSDPEDETEDIEDETFEIVKVSKKNNSIIVEHEDEEIELVSDDDEEIDVTDFEKGQEVIVSAAYDDEEEQWTLTKLEDAGDGDDDGDSDDDDDDEAPKSKSKGKLPNPKSKGKVKEAPAEKKKAKKEFTMNFKPIDTLTDDELELRLNMGLEAAETMEDEYPAVSELIMRSVAKVKRQIAKRED